MLFGKEKKREKKELTFSREKDFKNSRDFFLGLSVERVPSLRCRAKKKKERKEGKEEIY
jgi:hypothetical protein